MSIHLTTFQGSINQAIEKAIKDAIADADVEVQGSGGHFSIVVRSSVFMGQSKLQNHRLVLRAIKHLMAGDNAPVHAVDSLRTIAP
ncbi:MAG: BolA/IbaG family iron-sulfur metabolism protein [Proteobacteria bacterium]|nr:BolA/IbaG family iron-sulfur metabolism protein [Pseudomonadota bacterium]